MLILYNLLKKPSPILGPGLKSLYFIMYYF